MTRVDRHSQGLKTTPVKASGKVNSHLAQWAKLGSLPMDAACEMATRVELPRPRPTATPEDCPHRINCGDVSMTKAS